MSELFNAIRVVGLRQLLQLSKAHRRFWTNMISGFYSTYVIQTLFHVGFFDEISEQGRIRVEEFAASRQLDPKILADLCNYLYCIRILRKKGEEYSLDADGRLLVDTARGWFEATYGYQDVYSELENLLRKKKIYGRDVFRKPVHIASGSGRMEQKVYFPLAIDLIAKSKFRRVADLGCGDGRFLIDLCRKLPHVTAYGIDLSPEAVAAGTEQVRQAGLEDRITLFSEDITKTSRLPEPLTRVDAVTTFFVLHEILFHGEEVLIRFLKDFRRLFPGVPLIVFEVNRASLEETRKTTGMSAQYYLQHDLTGQRLVDSSKWHELFQAAGFESIEERYLKFAKTSIFTLR